MSVVAVSRAAARRAGMPGWAVGGPAWLAAVTSLVLAATAVESRYLTGDAFYDLYAGRYVVRHQIPHSNVFTAVAHGATWVDQQWLAQALFYGAWSAGGYPAMAALSAVLITGGFAVLGLIMLRRGVPPTRMFAWTAVAFSACLGNTAIRAQSFGYLFFALTLWLLAHDDRSPRLRARTWLLIPVLVLWANTHGSVLLGTGVTGLYGGYRAVRALARHDGRAVPPYLALGAAAGAALLCTPYGTGVVWYYSRTVGNPAITHNVMEWMPPSLTDPLSWSFFALAAAAAAAVALAWRRGTRPAPFLAGLTLLLFILALTGIRFQVWFAFGASLLAADTLARSAGRPPSLGVAFSRATAAALGALALASLAVLAVTPQRQFDSKIPRQAIDAAAAIALKDPAAGILGDLTSSAPMLWLHPALLGRVGFDVRLEQYSGSEITAYLDFLDVRGPRWQRITRSYGIIVVAARQHPGLASALSRLPGWRVAYRNQRGIVVVRQHVP